MRWCRGWSLLLLPGGLAAGHMLGYAAAGLTGHVPTVGDGEHSYVYTLLQWSVPLSLAVLARVLLSGARKEQLAIAFRRLAMQQVLAFVGLELFEHLAGGVGFVEALVETTLWWGIAAQLLVAYVLAMLLRGVGSVAARLARRRRNSRRRLDVRWRRPVALRPATVVPVWSLSRRGPPLAFC